MNTLIRLAAVLALSQAAPSGPAATGNSAPAAAARSVRVESIWDFLVKGGPVMIPIGACSLIALAVVIERSWLLRRQFVIPAAFVAGIDERLRDPASGRERGLQFCKEHDSPIARIFAPAIRNLGEPIERMEKRIEEAGAREVLKLRKHLRLLSLIASISTLLGLLGTILGLINAFETVAASGEALGKTELLAKGIYEAMITTAGGLFVAIPVLLAVHWLSTRIDGLVLEMDGMTVEFVERWTRGAAATESAGGSGNGDGRAAELAAPRVAALSA